MVSSGYINEMLISYLNFLGYAAMSIPILAYSLVKASEQGFVNFMSGMGGSISGTASSVASEKVSGANIGNTKVGGSTVTSEKNNYRYGWK
jgi:conjugal transfer mating pair stabilization protein TraG